MIPSARALADRAYLRAAPSGTLKTSTLREGGVNLGVAYVVGTQTTADRSCTRPPSPAPRLDRSATVKFGWATSASNTSPEVAQHRVCPAP